MPVNITEWRGHRTIEDSKPSHIDYIITFNCGYNDAIPDLGTTLSSWVAAKTLPSSNLHEEPTAVWKSQILRVTDLLGRITVRFRGFYTE
jgi:hypothetical protein